MGAIAISDMPKGAMTQIKLRNTVINVQMKPSSQVALSFGRTMTTFRSLAQTPVLENSLLPS